MVIPTFDTSRTSLVTLGVLYDWEACVIVKL